jgi:serine/threonine protein kinase
MAIHSPFSSQRMASYPGFLPLLDFFLFPFLPSCWLDDRDPAPKKKNGFKHRANLERTEKRLSTGGGIETRHLFQSRSLIQLARQNRLVWNRHAQDLLELTAHSCYPSAMVKTACEPQQKISLSREHYHYTLSDIASCSYIRTMLDVVDLDQEDAPVEAKMVATVKEPQCLVFEWMDHDLRHVPSDHYRQNSILPKIIAKSVLSALTLFKSPFDAIHSGECAALSSTFGIYPAKWYTDINPNNVFLSDIDGLSPVVKLGDLGSSMFSFRTKSEAVLILIAMIEGYDECRLQCLQTRAPEVWQGLGCWHSSDVWSVRVTVRSYARPSSGSLLIKKLVHWLYPKTIFGFRDKILRGMTEAWCIAKIRRLVGLLGPQAIIKSVYEEDFLLAEVIATTTFSHPTTGVATQYIKSGTLRQELERLPGPKVSLDLLEFID